MEGSSITTEVGMKNNASNGVNNTTTTNNCAATSTQDTDKPDEEFSNLIKYLFDQPILLDTSAGQSPESTTTESARIASASAVTRSSDSASLVEDGHSHTKSSTSKVRSKRGTSSASSIASDSGRSATTVATVTAMKKKKEEVEKARLIKENEELKSDILRLREKLQSLPVGEDPMSIENMLLKKSLEEHRMFITSCMTLSVPSERVALRSIAKRGADFMFNHVLNTVASSQNGKDWKPLNMKNYKFDQLNPGVNMTMCFRIRTDEKGRKMLDLRLDIVAPKYWSDDAADAIWKLSTDKATLQMLLGSANPCDFLCTFKENEDDKTDGDEEPVYDQAWFHVYREHYPAPAPPFDCALITARTRRDLAVSTLWSRPEYTPLAAIIRDQYTPIVHSQRVHARRTARRAPTATTTRSLRVGEARCHIHAHTATQYTSTDPSTGGAGPVPHWIKSHMTVGEVIWDDEAQIEIATPVVDEKGVENISLRRETVNATRLVGIMTLFDEGFKVQNFQGISSIMTPDGSVSPQLGVMLEMYCAMIHAETQKMSMERQKESGEVDSVESEATSTSASKRTR